MKKYTLFLFVLAFVFSFIINVGSVSAVTSVSYSVTTDKSVYTPDENIQITITAHNNSSGPVTLNFVSGCQISYSIDNLFNFNSIQLCTKSFTSVTIPGGSSKNWTLVHKPDYYRLPEGSHQINGEVIGYRTVSTAITVQP